MLLDVMLVSHQLHVQFVTLLTITICFQMALVNNVLSHVFVMVTLCPSTPIHQMVNNTAPLCVVMVSNVTLNNAMMATLSMAMVVPPLVRSNKLGPATMILSTLVALWKALNFHSVSTRFSKYPTGTP